ncbi:hypothetical protein TRICI_004988 [Trichomonascus ciferrii]|uniref:Glutaredoxin domain-containing protein n=1 Tax=Trichomonascus ciferrii TaxID=44093 RepID=A0A642V2I7_9ASCO|nr:hypothetical protein TRICI_004988 [Trichomonascus ciferrii]
MYARNRPKNDGVDWLIDLMEAWVFVALIGVYLMLNWLKNRFFPEEMPAAQHTERIAHLIKTNPVFVVSKATCPFCRQTLNTLGGLGAKPSVLDVQQEQEGNLLQKAVMNMTGQRTVPQIFIGGKFIGGNSELNRVEPTKLQQMLKEAQDAKGEHEIQL